MNTGLRWNTSWSAVQSCLAVMVVGIIQYVSLDPALILSSPLLSVLVALPLCIICRPVSDFRATIWWVFICMHALFTMVVLGLVVGEVTFIAMIVLLPMIVCVIGMLERFLAKDEKRAAHPYHIAELMPFVGVFIGGVFLLSNQLFTTKRSRTTD
jgi:hypothetical protein